MIAPLVESVIEFPFCEVNRLEHGNEVGGRDSSRSRTAGGPRSRSPGGPPAVKFAAAIIGAVGFQEAFLIEQSPERGAEGHVPRDATLSGVARRGADELHLPRLYPSARAWPSANP